MQLLYKWSNNFELIISHLVDTNSEVKLLMKIFEKHNVRSVLDVACGVGRHSIPLSMNGYSVTGIDYSIFQIKQARKSARRNGARPVFIKKNANDFNFRSKFDAAICMWTTLGEEPLQYRKVIKNVFRSLRKRGIFVIDNKSWEHIPKKGEKTIPNNIRMQNGDLMKSEIYDRYTDNFRIREVFYVINGKRYEDLCVTHLLREKDWIKELKEIGFEKFEVFHDLKKKKVKKPNRVTIVAVK